MEFIQEFSKNREASSLQEALRIKELETIVKVCDELKSLDSSISPFIYFKKAQALLALGREEEGLRVLDIAQDIFEENYGGQEQAYNWSKEVSDLYLKIVLEQAKRNWQNPSRSLWLYNEAYQLSREPEQRYEFRQLRYTAYQDLVNSQQELKRFVYIEDELPTTEPQLITPLLSNDVGNIRFVGAAPRKGTFWVAHPFKKRFYYYYENALQLAFNDYLNEFVQLMQHLGASKIVLTYSNMRQKEGEEDPAAEKLPDDASGSTSRQANTTSVEFEFKPTQKAHLPTHLAWYASQTGWQSIVAERSQGSISEFKTILSSHNILYLSQQEQEDVQEELNELLENNSRNLKNDNNKQKRRQRKLLKQDTPPTNLLKKDWVEIECSVQVTFAPLAELKEEVNLQTIEIVSVDFPKVSAQERKMTSVDVASVINEVIDKIQEVQKEEKSTPMKHKEAREKLAEEETAYDKWKKMLQETPSKDLPEETKESTETIQPKRERSVLDDFLTENPTTTPTENPQKEEKQEKEEKNEEKLVDSQGLTQDERFYYEMLQHAYQDGAISDDVRKVLERRRQRFKISEERAKEIEKMMLEKK